VSQANGSGSVAWHFTLTNTEVQQFFARPSGPPIAQSYDVTINEGDAGGSVTQRVGLTAGSLSHDTFIFAPDDGHNTVLNFQSGQDAIDVADFGLSEAELQILIDASSGDTIDFGGGDSLTLTGIDVAQLNAAADFIVSHGLA
jgi:hypothetical protein